MTDTKRERNYIQSRSAKTQEKESKKLIDRRLRLVMEMVYVFFAATILSDSNSHCILSCITRPSQYDLLLLRLNYVDSNEMLSKEKERNKRRSFMLSCTLLPLSLVLNPLHSHLTFFADKKGVTLACRHLFLIIHLLSLSSLALACLLVLLPRPVFL